ncbi:MAG: T9SS type A sorting domain-containing protein [Bacteroidetes bacterium]|nr:T9SS type A sorting domain-containing protein [Bacteroidota bacterium]
MKKTLLLSLFSLIVFSGLTAQDYTVTVSSFQFDPADLTIMVGETVQWENTGGTHNVNGSLATFPDNPEGFMFGAAAPAPWTFSHTFNTPGVYNYQCDPHSGIMQGTITVMTPPPPTNDMILTAVYDGPLTGGLPKGVEVYVVNDIPDLSTFGLGSANNGQGSDGQEFTFPAVAASAGDHLYVTTDEAGFTSYFGFAPDFIDDDGATNINGDDAVELFENGVVIDVFGEIDMDGSGTAWEHTDGWAYRLDGTGPDGTTFQIGNWIFSGVDALDGTNTNAEAPNPVPLGTYSLDPGAEVIANDDVVSVDQDDEVDFNTLTNDVLPNGPGSGIVITITQPTNGGLMDFGEGQYTYIPDPGYCGPDMFTYEVCDNTIPSCDTGTVNITVECPSTYPEYDIATVTTIGADGNVDSTGVSCQITGVVHGVDLQTSGSIQFTIIDATGGISLFSSSDLGYTVQEGDEVTVQGTIEAFNCLSQIAPDNIVLNSSGNSLVTPPVVTELDESTESELVRINGVTPTDPSQWDNMGTGMDIDVIDGDDNQFVVRIDDAVDLYSQPIPNFPWDVIGIGGQFDNDGTCNDGYQLLPRYSADIMSLVSTEEVSLEGQIRVFPNPVEDEVFWQTALDLERVELYDALGRSIRVLSNNDRSLNVSGLPAGMYLIRFTANEGQHTETLMVK